jgi:hypothetical protein
VVKRAVRADTPNPDFELKQYVKILVAEALKNHRLRPPVQRRAASVPEELCRKIGDGVNQAADLISATASIPSLNFIPLTTFGNWF